MKKSDKPAKKTTKTEVPSAKTLAATKIKTDVRAGREPLRKLGAEEVEKLP